jgi:hypothetical protein
VQAASKAYATVTMSPRWCQMRSSTAPPKPKKPKATRACAWHSPTRHRIRHSHQAIFNCANSLGSYYSVRYRSTNPAGLYRTSTRTALSGREQRGAARPQVGIGKGPTGHSFLTLVWPCSSYTTQESSPFLSSSSCMSVSEPDFRRSAAGCRH